MMNGCSTARSAWKVCIKSCPAHSCNISSRDTSRTCPACGHVEKANRPDQSTFSCVICGFAGLADHIAAINIGRRAVVNLPFVARDEAKTDPLLGLRLGAATSRPL